MALSPNFPLLPRSWLGHWTQAVQQGGVIRTSAEYGLQKTLDDLLPMFPELQLLFFPLFNSTALSQSEEFYERRRRTHVSGAVVSSEENRKVHRGRAEVSCYKLSPRFAIAEQIFGRTCSKEHDFPILVNWSLWHLAVNDEIFWAMGQVDCGQDGWGLLSHRPNTTPLISNIPFSLIHGHLTFVLWPFLRSMSTSWHDLPYNPV